jgi:hypothetical protein
MANLPYVQIQLESSSDTKTQIMNGCIEYILDIFDIHTDFNAETLEQMFKGFIVKNGEIQKDIFMFFDLTTKIKYFKETEIVAEDATNATNATNAVNYKWGILDQIVNVGNIGGVPIRPDISALFKETPVLTELYLYLPDEIYENKINKRLVEYPFSLYLLSKGPERGIIHTIKLPKNAGGWPFIVEKKTNHPIIGEHYLFSTNILPNSKETAKETVGGDGEVPENKTEEAVTVEPSWNKYELYAVFLNINNGCCPDDEKYIIKDLTEWSEDQKTQYVKLTTEDLMDVSTVWFNDGGNQYWSIKYPSQFYRLS